MLLKFKHSARVFVYLRTFSLSKGNIFFSETLHSIGTLDIKPVG